MPISNFKGNLPADLYYINQVAVNNAVSPTTENELTELLKQVKDIQTKLSDNPDQNFDLELRNLNSRIVVLENIYMTNESMLTPLAYCTTNFPEALHCDDCVNRSAKAKECYYVDTDKIKTSFTSGQVCLSYMAFPTDDDCFPLVPDDISYKEAMFWYIYKKILLGGQVPVENGINYTFAEQQWKYY